MNINNKTIMRLAASWIVIDKENRILLLKRSNYTKAFPHHWTMPWWRWETWENPEDIVKREVKEEAWLDFTPTRLIMDTIIENVWTPVHSHRYLWEWTWKVNIQDEEADWFAWYSYEETKNLKIAFDYKEVIEKLYNEWMIN